jgi:hypothetical protein
MRRRLQPDQRAEALRMFEREMQDDAPADRAAHRHRLVEFERIGNAEDDVGVVARGETILFVLPAGRGRGFPMPGKIERDDAEVLGDARIVEQAAILPRVGTGGVQA